MLLDRADQHCKDIYLDKVIYRLSGREIMILHLKLHYKAVVTKKKNPSMAQNQDCRALE